MFSECCRAACIRTGLALNSGTPAFTRSAFVASMTARSFSEMENGAASAARMTGASAANDKHIGSIQTLMVQSPDPYDTHAKNVPGERQARISKSEIRNKHE